MLAQILLLRTLFALILYIFCVYSVYILYIFRVRLANIESSLWTLLIGAQIKNRIENQLRSELLKVH